MTDAHQRKMQIGKCVSRIYREGGWYVGFGIRVNVGFVRDLYRLFPDLLRFDLLNNTDDINRFMVTCDYLEEHDGAKIARALREYITEFMQLPIGELI